MASAESTELRRLMSEVEPTKSSCASAAALEEQLLAERALTWPEAADKARYMLSLLRSRHRAGPPPPVLIAGNRDFIR